MFRTSFVFVTTERIIIKKTKHWILSWGIGVVIGVLGPVLSLLKLLDPTVGYTLQIVIPILTALGLQRLFNRKYRTFRHIQTEEGDIQITKSHVIQVQFSPFHGVQPARLTITPTIGEVVSLPFINEKPYKVAVRLMTIFNPNAIRPPESRR